MGINSVEKDLSVFFALQQVLAEFLLLAADEEFEVLEIGGPAKTIEEFSSRELDLVKCVGQEARAQVKEIEAPRSKGFHCPGHHVHAQVPRVVTQIVKGEL